MGEFSWRPNLKETYFCEQQRSDHKKISLQIVWRLIFFFLLIVARLQTTFLSRLYDFSQFMDFLKFVNIF